jgi:hypothetical protein
MISKRLKFIRLKNINFRRCIKNLKQKVRQKKAKHLSPMSIKIVLKGAINSILNLINPKPKKTDAKI